MIKPQLLNNVYRQRKICFKTGFKLAMPNNITNSQIQPKTSTKRMERGPHREGNTTFATEKSLPGKPIKQVANVTAIQYFKDKEEAIYVNEYMEWPQLTKPIHTDDLAAHVKNINQNAVMLSDEYRVGGIHDMKLSNT